MLIDDESETDDIYWLASCPEDNEFTLMRRCSDMPSGNFHQTEEATKCVLQVWGKSDEEIGDCTDYIEYEDDPDEEIIVTREFYPGGEEIYSGFYLDPYEISESDNRSCSWDDDDEHHSNQRKTPSSAPRGKLFAVIFILMLILPLLVHILSGITAKNKETLSIKTYLDNNNRYFSLLTTLPSEDKSNMAYVYKSGKTIDETVETILDGIQNPDCNVQQNESMLDNSVTILTDSEYCIIYKSLKRDVLAQVSDRKFAYNYSGIPYEAGDATGKYYRNFYFSFALLYDRRLFEGSRSAYDSDNERHQREQIRRSQYNKYSQHHASNTAHQKSSGHTIRQGSTGTRRSSGGGISSGK